MIKIGDFDYFFDDRNLNDFYIKKGTDFFGFTLPDNFIGSKNELYNMYGLWDNLNGVGVAGRSLSVFKIFQETIVFKERPFLGDFIVGFGFLIEFSLNRNSEEYLWIIANYKFSTNAPTPKNLIRKNEYSDKINTIIDSILFLVDGITVIGAPIPDGTVTGESPNWLANKQQIKQNLNQLKNELEEVKL